MKTDPVASRAPSPAEDLFADYVLRLSGGKADDFDALCAAHPVLAAELRELRARHLGAQVRERALDLGALPATAAGVGTDNAAILEELRGRGAQVARYRVVEKIGAGGMGTVYDAEDVLLGRHVALKVISDAGRTKDLLPLFHREMRIAARISHPGVAGIHDAGVDEQGRAFFTMPLVSGRDLSEAFRFVREKRDGWTVPRALGVLRQVCETMAYVHSRGVIHCDLKPSNVRVGSFGEVFVMDWGLAREFAPTVGTAPQLFREPPDANQVPRRGHGTPPYISPEQARGEDVTLGAATDVYAIGSMLYELLAGRGPYLLQGESPSSAALLERTLSGPPAAIHDVAPNQPPELFAICTKAMNRDAAARYASCLQMARDLTSFLDGRVVSAYATGAWAEAKKWIARNKALAASVGLATTSLFAGALVAMQLRSHNVLLATEQRLAKEQAARDMERAQATYQHARLLESYLSAAQIARQRGAWRQVLANVELARQAGFGDALELALLEAEVRLWTGEPKDAVERLDGVVFQSGTSKQRARSHLIRAQALQARLGDNDLALEHVRLAMAEDLSNADRQFASGLMETSTAASLSRFEEALRSEPLHFAAMSARLTTLFFLGRLDEALEQANVLTRCYPDDPHALVMITLLETLVHGRTITTQSLQPLADRLSPESVSRVKAALESFVFFNTLPTNVTMGMFDEHRFQDMVAAMTDLLFSPLLDPAQDSWMLVPKVPAVAHAYEALGLMFVPEDTRSAVDGASAVLRISEVPFLQTPEKCATTLEGVLQYHAEASLHFFHGVAVLTGDPRVGESQADKLRRCLPSFEKALSTPCILPKVRNMARFLAARCFNDLLNHFGDETVRARAVAMTRSEAVDETSDLEEIRTLGSLAMLCGATSDGLRLIDEWIKKHPDDLDSRASRIHALRMLGAPGAALKEAELLVHEHPENARLREARDLAAAAVEELREQ